MLTGNDSGAGDGHSGWIQRRQEVDTAVQVGERQARDRRPSGTAGQRHGCGAPSEMKPEEQLPGHLEGRGASFLRG